MKRFLVVITLIPILTACNNTLPKGADFWTTDFANYNRNYADFETDRLKIGMTRQEVISVLGDKFVVIKKNSNSEVIEYERLKSSYVDYVGWTLHVSFKDNLLEEWKINTLEKNKRH